ncbi:MAG: AAA family ATPase, partial [Planctomycetes bacterium]|nr:AAA family ATPase [Planctomycetota bacterium]
RGVVAILCGAKSSGKTQIAYRIIGATTTGGTLPVDGAEVRVPLGRVLYLGAEDAPEEIIVPRLVAAGADLGNVRHLDYIENPEGVPHVLTLRHHWAEIVRHAEEMRREEREEGKAPLAAFVVDTLYSHCGCDVNSSEEMSPVMGRLLWFAAEYDVVVLVIHHPVKIAHARASADVAGATCIGTMARIQLMAGTNEDKSRRALFHLDSNLGAEARPLGYRIEAATVELDGETFETSRVVFTGGTDLTLDEIRHHRAPREDAVPAKGEALLRAMLSGGPRKVEEIEAGFRKAGLTVKYALAEARKALGCVSARIGPAGWLALPEHGERLLALKAEHETQGAGDGRKNTY